MWTVELLLTYADGGSMKVPVSVHARCANGACDAAAVAVMDYEEWTEGDGPVVNVDVLAVYPDY